MTLLPLAVLLLGPFMVWLGRRRSARFAWLSSLITVLFAWIMALLLSTSLPQVTQVSVWRPVSLYAGGLELSLDRYSWTLVYTCITILLAVTLTEPMRELRLPAKVYGFALVYTAIPLLSFMANNLLTVAVAWGLMDTTNAIILLRLGGGVRRNRQLIIRFMVDAVSVLMLLTAALLDAAGEGSQSFKQSLSSGPAFLVLVIAVLLRLGLLPLHFSLPPLGELRRGLGTIIRFFPPAAALAVLARAIRYEIPADARLWLIVAGSLGVVIGGLRWALETDVVRARPFLVFSVSGLGVLAALTSVDDSGLTVVGSGVLLMITGSIASLVEPYSPSHKIWPLYGGLMLCGAPGTPGVVLTEAFGRGFGMGGAWIAILGIVGMSLLTLGMIRLVVQPVMPWPANESLVRGMYSLGLAIPCLAGVGLGVHLSTGFRLISLAVAGAGVLLGIVGFLLVRGRPVRDRVRWQRMLTWLDPQPLYQIGLNLGSRLTSIMRELATILDGEGALLWMLVVLLMIYLGIREGL